MKSGILVIDKEPNWTSFDVIGKLRSVLRIKKMGHTGTLDPMATGVLPICIGKATKLVSSLENDQKTYQTEFELGWMTDTQDATGRTLRQQSVSLQEDVVKENILSFVGAYRQVPPMYSAVSVGGKRLYQLAREGIEVERAAKDKWIYAIEDICFHLPRVSMTVTCSKGTYIRTLCADIGEKLGVGACMTGLRRVKAGRFDIHQSLKIEEVIALYEANTLDHYLIPIDDLLSEYPRLTVSMKKATVLYNGGEFELKDTDLDKEPEGRYRVYLENQELIGVYEYQKNNNIFKIWKMFKE